MNNLSSSGHLFSLLGSMYLCKPTGEALASWQQLLKDEPLVEAEDLRKALDAVDLDSEQELEDLLWEYTRLFIGPNHLPCPPFESVYTSPQRLVMQDAYDQVRKIYRGIGVEIGSADVMPDHIGAELNFLAVVFLSMESEPDKYSYYATLAEKFLTGHLRNWVPRFTADMAEASATVFYKTLAQITQKAVG
jgi:putative dimethyl sulfoxide reductase chaperone